MATPDEARIRARSTYNAAADAFDAPALSFWDYFGKQTIRRLKLKAGDLVLDAARGSGASALPAAVAVGPTGSVLGVDLAERLLQLGEIKAADQGLTNSIARA